MKSNEAIFFEMCAQSKLTNGGSISEFTTSLFQQGGRAMIKMEFHDLNKKSLLRWSKVRLLIPFY